jgi:multidrug resistance protein MdtO
MAPPVSDRRPAGLIWSPRRFATLLAPFPGRLEFAARLALICALTTLMVEIYQTPEPALTVYVAFFLIRSDRAASIVVSIALLLLVTLIIGAVLAITMLVIDQPLWRAAAMAVVSFCVLFAASASKLRPIGGTVALIAAYALDLLGTAHTGEVATRALLYAWLFVGIPAGVCIVVNCVLGPSPRLLAGRALAHRLHLCAALLRDPSPVTRRALDRAGSGEILEWLKLAGAEKTSPARDIAALLQATHSTGVIMSVVDVIAREAEPLLSEPARKRMARTLEDMAAILRAGGYPVGVTARNKGEDPDATRENSKANSWDSQVAAADTGGEAMPSPLAVAALAELQAALTGFAEPSPPDEPRPAEREPGGFLLPDAFANPLHVHYALKTTAAAMFCYVVYSLLDWPGIHTCLITCYIVSLGTAAETVEKLTLRILGCLLGAAMGIAAIVFVMPSVTSAGGLMAIVFLAALVSGWVVAGGPRVSYIGFQIAFAFFLSVVQGPAPEFDMSIARDRVIGILFGDFVVAVVFMSIWPVSVAERIDPAIAALLRLLAALAAAGSRATRWRLATEAEAALGAIEQDLELTRYEPPSIRPARGWLDRGRHVAQAIASLRGPLLIGTDQEPAISGGMTRRLKRLAEEFSAQSGSVSGAHGPDPTGAIQVMIVQRPINRGTVLEEMPASGSAMTDGEQRPRQKDRPADSVASAFIEAPLARLEQAVARSCEPDAAAGASHARA